MSTLRILGIDAYKAGWVGIMLDNGVVVAHIAPGIAELVAAVEQDGPVRAVAIDIPIGLPDKDCREADVLAKEKVGPRRNSVFMTPVRSSIEADTYEEALARNRELAGKGMSKQAFGLRKKILEVECWVGTRTARKVVEGHPEVSFATLSGAPLPHGKRTWAGVHRRRALLAKAGIVLSEDLGAAGVVPMDDVLDAAGMAWTARRVAKGEASSLPDPPQKFNDGWECAIWA